jgi:uncharacterized surface protein with fasciclin (FAS1) repeats
MKKLFALAVAVLFAPLAFAADDAKKEEKADTSKMTIVEVAAGNKDFSTLVTAVKAADLVETLSGGEFTVFAPTNKAFEALPKEALEAVLKDKKKLTAILTAHAVKGSVMAADVLKMDGKEAETVQGTKFKITVKDKDVMIGKAKVIMTDIKCKNGVIHVIDTVLMPETK